MAAQRFLTLNLGGLARVRESPNGYNSAQKTMTPVLSSLLEVVRDATDLAALRERLVPRATRFFAATRGALFVFAEFPPEAMPARENPVARALFEHHTPIHEGSVLAPGQWGAICQRADHGHVLAGPIVQGGELVGVLAFTRAVGLPEFDAQNLADLSALCLHVSTRLERLATQKRSHVAAGWQITPREAQIVPLVAQGLTNAQIADRLYVSSETIKQAMKRLFRKTGVTSRTQLATSALSQVAQSQVSESASTTSRNSAKSRANSGG